MIYEKKIIVGMTIISAFVLIVGLSSFYVQTQIDSGNVCGCIIPISLFIPFLASVGLFIGSMIYYFLNPVSRPTKIKRDVVLRVFEAQERKLLELLLDSGGEMLQSRIVSETAMDKVKVFRLIERLSRKGIVRKEPHGKTNNIILSEELKNSIK
jgi:uncharacterized membrane protein